MHKTRQKGKRHLSFWQKRKKMIMKNLSVTSGLLIILQVSISSLFFISLPAISNFKSAKAVNVNLCEADVDVVLVMDRSGSMGDTSICDWWELKCINPPSCSDGYDWIFNTTYNQTEDWCAAQNQAAPHQSVWTIYDPVKIIAAKQTANDFLGLLGINDQSGLVSFADTASLDQGLSNNHSATQTAVNNLTPDRATNIGAAIDLGNQELGSTRANAQAMPVMILLTDGKANKPNGSGYGEYPADVAYAESMAAEAASAGYKIFTIGFNGDVNATMLENIANMTGANYYFAPTLQDLEDIYNQISMRICDYGSISGCKYEDSNNDQGIENEQKLPGWEIILSGDADRSQETDGDGCYQFSGLLPGDYIVSEGGKVGVAYEQTYPTQNFYVLSLAEGQNAGGYDFANYLPICGNNIEDLDQGEECDDGNLQDGDGCSAVCEIELPQPACGDGVVNEGEQCDDGNTQSGDGCSSTCQIETPAPACGDGNLNVGEECDDGNTDDGDGCSAICEIEELGIQSGDIIINEIMQNPEAVSDLDGEWFEIYNTSDSNFDLNGCIIKDNGSNSHTISSSFIVPAQEYAVLAKEDNVALNGGLDVDYKWIGAFTLGNSDDEIILLCNNTEIDRVEYDGGPQFPDPAGASMILANSSLDNNIGANWCVSSSVFGNGDLGTPGAQNDICGGIVYCGNEIQEGEEQCDDGNTQNGDGCSSICEIEPLGIISGYKYASTTDGLVGLENWTINLFNQDSSTTPITSTSTNGNGYYKFLDLVPADYILIEEIKDNWTQLSSPSGIISILYGIVSENNNFINLFGDGPIIEQPFCGDGNTDTGEQCDDGNNTNGDGCSASCTTEGNGGGGGNGNGGGGTYGGGFTGGGISNESVRATEVYETSVTIIWTTSYLSTSEVVYDTKPDMYDFDAGPSNFGYSYIKQGDDSGIEKVTAHKVTITGLSPGTTYYFRVVSYASPPAMSYEFVFTTIASKKESGEGGIGGDPIVEKEPVPVLGEEIEEPKQKPDEEVKVLGVEFNPAPSVNSQDLEEDIISDQVEEIEPTVISDEDRKDKEEATVSTLTAPDESRPKQFSLLRIAGLLLLILIIIIFILKARKKDGIQE